MVTLYYITEMSKKKSELRSEFSNYFKTSLTDNTLKEYVSCEKRRLKCRVCCLQTGRVPLFDGNNEAIRNLLVKITGIEVDENDDLPKQICSICYEFLEVAIQFREVAKQTEKMYKQHVTHNQQSSNNSKHSVDWNVKSLENNDVTAAATQATMDKDLTSQSKKYPVDPRTKSFQNVNSKSVLLHPNLSYVCEYCKKIFTSLFYLDHHRCVHMKAFSKVHNKSRFSPSKDLKSTNLVEHVDIEKKAEGITSSVASKMKDRYHELFIIPEATEGTVHEEKVTCKICNLSIKYLSMPNHYRIHKSSPDYMCEHCGKLFLYSKSLYSHLAIHFNIFPFKCTLCPYKGRDKDRLRSHVKKHENILKYKCSICAVKFRHVSNLNRHLKTEHQEPKLKCDICSKLFHFKYRLKSHIEVRHMGIKKYKCPLCGCFYSSKKQRRIHEITKHNRPKLGSGDKSYYIKFQGQEDKD